MGSIVPGKFRAGGQSAARFARARRELVKDWYKKVAEEMRRSFMRLENLKGILSTLFTFAHAQLTLFIGFWSLMRRKPYKWQPLEDTRRY